MQKSLFKKFIVCSLIALFATMVVLFGLLMVMFRSFWMSEKVAVFKSEISSLSTQLDQFNGIINYDYQVNRLLSAMALPYNGDLFLVNSRGKIEMSSNWDYVSKTINPNALAESRTENITGFGNFNDLLPYQSFYFITPFSNGYVVATTPSDGLVYYLTRIGKILLFSALIAMVIAITAIYFLTYRMVKPLKQMSLAAQKMSQGDFTLYIKVDREDEIGELAEAFNNMTRSISAGEQMRRDFVAGVSHELKTPMTTIAGFIDGILDGTIPRTEADEYLKIVSIEVKRLARLVTSMLNLSKIESGEQTLSLCQTDLGKTTIDIALGFEQRINAKNLEIIGLEMLDNTTVMADPDMIYQVIYNLIDNAIKYTPENGYIKFSSNRTETTLNMSILNSGNGIPVEQLPHIFERFYKVDKSHTGTKSGAGLGLFLVKTILDQHNATIAVNTVQGQYTEFIYTFTTANLTDKPTPPKKIKFLNSSKHKENKNGQQ